MQIGTNVFHYIDTDRYSAALQRGATFYTTVYVYQTCLNLPNSLDAYKPRLVVKDCQNQTVLLCSLDNNRCAIDLPRAKITFTVSAADTAQLVDGFYEYFIDIQSIDNLVYRLAYGRFEITSAQGDVGCH